MSAAEIAAPTTAQEATRLLKRHAGVQQKIAAIEAGRTRAIADANAAADKKLLPLVAQIGAMTAAIEPWWRANAAALTKGERKSIELGGCEVGTAFAAPSLAFDGDQKDFGVKALQATKWGKEFVRTVVSTDKVAVRKALSGKRAEELKAIGFKLAQAESFFVKAVELPTVKA